MTILLFTCLNIMYNDSLVYDQTIRTATNFRVERIVVLLLHTHGHAPHLSQCVTPIINIVADMRAPHVAFYDVLRCHFSSNSLTFTSMVCLRKEGEQGRLCKACQKF
ncbi:hypothetical protein MtrunA17_Chr3g0129111 [Medicago truncatula]|uniref:Uncharacterized protein n=1 Tax=Medicago truncatula TaxID=3880 RepID=A0A072V1K3_MEDTR|nr:hypothetical protein MTR_3g094745 [Medicago truncatula]RHN69839.1 hypothetical protein MtrunA17_Chr3g0129111 [Medicago truncatula]